MDLLVMVATLPVDVMEAVTAYRMMSLQHDIEKQSLREVHSMFTLKTFGGSAVEELQERMKIADANQLLALVNLFRAIGRHTQEVDIILKEWRTLHPATFSM